MSFQTTNKMTDKYLLNLFYAKSFIKLNNILIDSVKVYFSIVTNEKLFLSETP